MKRSGFTMIELIFVIVILGILAAVAIPKLAATRDDAQVSKEVTNLSTKINDLGAQYTAKGAFTAQDITNANLAMGCYSLAGGTEGNLTVTEQASNAGSTTQTAATAAVCTAAHVLSRKQKISDTSPVTHNFGGSNVTF
ncbi:MAG: prepilin-type N-terminal cleavage/methylation domain-containing protein [Sulfuricurvum sp.]|nr:prepilin-type N-terminal cleavage/methylation domain-containing protein [Sulfuricurvum sp.]MDP3465309.1 prepilin-type N-terminal cleavage/methylation domain-containing protein [Sulfuricurvum sp.]